METNLEIAKILSSQNDLRNISQISQMVDYVKSGGFFTKEELLKHAVLYDRRADPPLIALTVFPDGVVMAHDGHHRLCSIYLGGRKKLRLDECKLNTSFTYKNYMDINLKVGWVTPFDPLTQIRLCEFAPYKKEVRRLLEEAPDQIEMYIRNNGHLYSAARDIRYIPELAERVASRLAVDPSSANGSEYCISQRW